MKEAPRKKQFQNDLMNMKIMLDKSQIRVIDGKQLLESGFKLMLEFERVFEAREKWKLKYQELVAKNVRSKNVPS